MSQSDTAGDALGVEPDGTLAGLCLEDLRFLAEWVSAMGDEATGAHVQSMVKQLLALRERHPERPTLEVLTRDRYVRAVMFAPPRLRKGAVERLNRHFEALTAEVG